nr:2-phosphoglycerate kinase [Ipomoea batatas]
MYITTSWTDRNPGMRFCQCLDVSAASPSEDGDNGEKFTDGDDEREEHSGAEAEASKLNNSSARFFTRNASSKYDFVKVKVWLGENANHYYVLSRFLLSRMLTVTKIPNHVAIKIALELKKLLVDNSLLDVSQSDLEANLFKLMERRGYGEEYINRYKMMTRFHHQRVPLVILVCGTACVGKSTISSLLAQRLNLPNVLKTEMVYELLRTSTDAPLSSTPVWARDFNSSDELITEFCRECRVVRKGLAGDLNKAMKDGKPIIIEGMHLDPSIYLMDEENKSPSAAPSTEGGGSKSDTVVDKNEIQNHSNSSAEIDSSSNDKDCDSENVSLGKEVFADELNKATGALESLLNETKDKAVKYSTADEKPALRRAKSGAEPIIVHIVLKMAEFDHGAMLEEWISTRTGGDKYPVQDKDKLRNNLKIIQDYLCSFESQGLTVVNTSAAAFPQALDWLHNYLLQRIEEGISSVPSGNSGQAASD